MPEIFVNYRTADQAGVADHIQADLSRRFGREHVFYASQSIKSGENFTKELLPAVRRSTVLLAVIGPDWLAANSRGERAIDNPADWTRREIITAFDFGVHVIPILVGRKTERLSEGDLPPELVELAQRQSLLFDTRDSAACLDKIAADVADLVPGLVDRTVAPEPDTPRETRDRSHNLHGVGSVNIGGDGSIVGSPTLGNGSFIGSPAISDGSFVGSPTLGDGSVVGSPKFGEGSVVGSQQFGEGAIVGSQEFGDGPVVGKVDGDVQFGDRRDNGPSQ
ncbi:toll/interleukin-1 receptor domain-containing protein [Amycolatopsis sp. 195334CR]|uniref:toll/interleukin-1 receptor domain-containing protein n=1 Tax=Amycolatopsis sp. 195334CR TaxID=2814588 RepID=UPI001A90BD31|nr:toll/interleukin-1 receptor domain-containing protein [Amycolatopsis sp. 195334CR]MBN6036542.1 TIR domain-containing protein [Amycolatopsis sp. 195334CR]